MKHHTSMLTKVNEYVQFRRGLGYQLKAGRLLQRFGAIADEVGHRGPLTIELALRWARLSEGCKPCCWAQRLEIVRCFAKHLAATEPGTQVPPRGLLGPAHRRAIPHIFTNAELARLIAAARRLEPLNGLRPWTHSTLLGLLSCTGLRVSEALHLTRADTDLNLGILKIRQSKFGKNRWVPMHPTATSP